MAPDEHQYTLAGPPLRSPTGSQTHPPHGFHGRCTPASRPPATKEGPWTRSSGGGSMTEVRVVVAHQEQLWGLVEAAQLEHMIICQYLYAEFSLKNGIGPSRWTPCTSSGSRSKGRSPNTGGRGSTPSTPGASSVCCQPQTRHPPNRADSHRP